MYNVHSETLILTANSRFVSRRPRPCWTCSIIWLTRLCKYHITWSITTKHWTTGSSDKHNADYNRTFALISFSALMLRWYGHVLRKKDNDWVKKCMEYEVKCARPTGRPKKTWREIVEKDCQACKLSREDAIDHNRWRKQMTTTGVSGWMFLLVPAHTGCPEQNPESVKRLCVCVCVCVF